MGPASAGLGSKRFSEKYGDEGRASSAQEATPGQQPPQPPAAPQLGAPARPPELQPGAAAAAAPPVASPGTSPVQTGRRRREVYGGHTPREPAAVLARQPRQQPSLASAAEPPGSARGQQAETSYSMGSPRGAAASGAVTALLPAAGRLPEVAAGRLAEVAAAEGVPREQQDEEAPGSQRRGRPSAPISALRRAQEQLTPRGSAAAPVPAAVLAAKEVHAERPSREQQDEEAPGSQRRNAPISAARWAQEQLTPRGFPATPVPATAPAAKEDRQAVGLGVAAASGRASPSGSNRLRTLPLGSASSVREKPKSAAARMYQPGDAESSALPAEARASEASQEQNLQDARAAVPKRGYAKSSTALARRQAAEPPRAWQLPEARGAASQPGNAGSSTDNRLSADPVPSGGLQTYKSTTARALLAKLRGIQQLDPEETGEAAVHCLWLTERPAAAPRIVEAMQLLFWWCVLQLPIPISPRCA